MKEITLEIFNQKENCSFGDKIVESSYRVVNIDRLLLATKKSIISLIEKIEEENIEWLEGRIEALMNGDSKSDSFYINNHYYVFNA